MPAPVSHHRMHNLLLIEDLLNVSGGKSPFTLVLENLEQAATPLIEEYIRRTKDKNGNSKINTVFVGFDTLKKPTGVDHFIRPWLETVAWDTMLRKTLDETRSNERHTLLIIDSLTSLISSTTSNTSLPTLLSSFLSPKISLLATYNLNIPLSASSPQHQSNPYAPSPLTSVRFAATTILSVQPLHHALAAKRAADRSLPAPTFEISDGSLHSPGANDPVVVFTMEHRRRSGREVRETYYLSQRSVGLLAEHALFAPANGAGKGEGEDGGEGDVQTTFNLGLTDEQRRKRGEVQLPYHDAQKGLGGEGGRILYSMGSEDDFDEEEDEI